MQTNFDVFARIFEYAARYGINTIFHALNPDKQDYLETGIPQLVKYLGGLDNIPPGYQMGFGDDWPLWVPDARANKCPSPTCGRNLAGFETMLGEVITAWESIGKKYPIFIPFHQPEASATNAYYRGKCFDQDGKNIFRQDGYDMALKYLVP